jgi:hypothetical protein
MLEISRMYLQTISTIDSLYYLRLELSTVLLVDEDVTVE